MTNTTGNNNSNSRRTPASGQTRTPAYRTGPGTNSECL